MPVGENEGVLRLETLTDEERERMARRVGPPVVVKDPPAFYVDSCVNAWRGKKWAHLMTTGTEDDLVAFGRRIGLRASWLQHPGTDRVHFDVTEPYRAAAIKAGALPAASVVMLRACVLSKRPGKETGSVVAVLEALRDTDAGKERTPTGEEETPEE